MYSKGKSLSIRDTFTGSFTGSFRYCLGRRTMQHFLTILPQVNPPRLIAFGTVLPVLLVMLLTSLPASAQNLPNRGSGDATRLEEVQQDIEKLRELLKKIRKERSTIETRLENTEKEISNVQKNLKNTETELKKAKATEKQQETMRKKLKEDLIIKQQDVSQVLKAAYLAGQSPYLKLILNQEDPALTGRMLAYYDHFVDIQADRLKDLNEANRKLDIVELQLTKTNQRIEARRQHLTQQQDRYKAIKKSRQKTLTKLNLQAEESSGRINRLKTEQKDLLQLLSFIMPLTDTSTIDQPFNKARGKLRWPLKGKIQHFYGEQREDTRLTWNGIFIQALAGTPVTAPYHGRVVFSDWMKSYGQLLIIDHGNGYMTLYAHNQELLKTEGDWVLPGEQIALTGDSGGQSQAGLYFEIRHEGRPSDPSAWLVASS